MFLITISTSSEPAFHMTIQNEQIQRCTNSTNNVLVRYIQAKSELVGDRCAHLHLLPLYLRLNLDNQILDKFLTL